MKPPQNQQHLDDLRHVRQAEVAKSIEQENVIHKSSDSEQSKKSLTTSLDENIQDIFYSSIQPNIQQRKMEAFELVLLTIQEKEYKLEMKRAFNKMLQNCVDKVKRNEKYVKVLEQITPKIKSILCDWGMHELKKNNKLHALLDIHRKSTLRAHLK